MYDTIIMIPGRPENILKPVSKWVFSIRILGSINMQTQINANKQVTEVAKLVFFIGYYQKQNKNKRQYVFKQPISHVGRAYK